MNFNSKSPQKTPQPQQPVTKLLRHRGQLWGGGQNQGSEALAHLPPNVLRLILRPLVIPLVVGGVEGHHDHFCPLGHSHWLAVLLVPLQSASTLHVVLHILLGASNLHGLVRHNPLNSEDQSHELGVAEKFSFFLRATWSNAK